MASQEELVMRKKRTRKMKFACNLEGFLSVFAMVRARMANRSFSGHDSSIGGLWCWLHCGRSRSVYFGNVSLTNSQWTRLASIGTLGAFGAATAPLVAIASKCLYTQRPVDRISVRDYGYVASLMRLAMLTYDH
ncbi:hypothetical protein JOM56_008922 [Amanita muscaria]